jgi:hypothetical protein
MLALLMLTATADCTPDGAAQAGGYPSADRSGGALARRQEDPCVTGKDKQATDEAEPSGREAIEVGVYASHSHPGDDASPSFKRHERRAGRRDRKPSAGAPGKHPLSRSWHEGYPAMPSGLRTLRGLVECPGRRCIPLWLTLVYAIEPARERR